MTTPTESMRNIITLLEGTELEAQRPTRQGLQQRQFDQLRRRRQVPPILAGWEEPEGGSTQTLISFASGGFTPANLSRMLTQARIEELYFEVNRDPDTGETSCSVRPHVKDLTDGDDDEDYDDYEELPDDDDEPAAAQHQDADGEASEWFEGQEFHALVGAICGHLLGMPAFTDFRHEDWWDHPTQLYVSSDAFNTAWENVVNRWIALLWDASRDQQQQIVADARARL